MKEFDLVVIGAGSGLHVADAAIERGLSVAVVEEGPMGGTCLNRGCIPSKAIIHSADVAELTERAPVFGIKPSGYKVDFASVTKRASLAVNKDAGAIERSIRATQNMTLFKKRCRFVAERCAQEVPPLQAIRSGHRSACWVAETLQETVSSS